MPAIGAPLGIAAGLPVLAGLAVARAGVKGALAAGVTVIAGLDPSVGGIGRREAVILTLWLAWRLMRRLGGIDGQTGVAGFRDALLVQLSNPKSFLTGLAAAALFATDRTAGLRDANALTAVAFSAVPLAAGPWLLAGHAGAAWLRGPRRTRMLHVVARVTLVPALGPLVLGASGVVSSTDAQSAASRRGGPDPRPPSSRRPA